MPFEVKIMGELKRRLENDTFAIIDDSVVRGGFRCEPSLDALKQVPAEVLKQNCLALTDDTNSIYTWAEKAGQWTYLTTLDLLRFGVHFMAGPITADNKLPDPALIPDSERVAVYENFTSGNEDFLKFTYYNQVKDKYTGKPYWKAAMTTNEQTPVLAKGTIDVKKGKNDISVITLEALNNDGSGNMSLMNIGNYGKAGELQIADFAGHMKFHMNADGIHLQNLNPELGKVGSFDFVHTGNAIEKLKADFITKEGGTIRTGNLDFKTKTALRVDLTKDDGSYRDTAEVMKVTDGSAGRLELGSSKLPVAIYSSKLPVWLTNSKGDFKRFVFANETISDGLILELTNKDSSYQAGNGIKFTHNNRFGTRVLVNGLIKVADADEGHIVVGDASLQTVVMSSFAPVWESGGGVKKSFAIMGESNTGGLILDATDKATSFANSNGLKFSHENEVGNAEITNGIVKIDNGLAAHIVVGDEKHLTRIHSSDAPVWRSAGPDSDKTFLFDDTPAGTEVYARNSANGWIKTVPFTEFDSLRKELESALERIYKLENPTP